MSRPIKPDIGHVGAVRELFGEPTDQQPGQVLVKQQPHAGVASRRSRTAANSIAARTWSSVSSGKPPTISAVVIPPARCSSTSQTVMRVPTNDGLPPRTPSRFDQRQQV